MTKKITKLVSLVLSVVIVAVFLAACASEAAQNTSKDSAAGTAASGKITDSKVTLRVVRWENPAQPIKLDSTAIKEIYNKTGVEIQLEPIPQSNYEDKKRVMISTNNLPDILEVSQKDLNDFAHTGVFLPLMDKINQMGPNFKKFMDANPELSKFYIDNELYAFPVSGYNWVDYGRFPMIRGDMLEKLNLKMPSTYDELIDVLAKMKQANPDNVIWSNRNKTKNLIVCVAYPLGSGYDADLSYYYDEDVNGGSFLYGPAHPEFKNVLEFLNKAYKAKVIDPDYAVSTAAQWQEKLGTGKASFFFDNASFAANFNKTLGATDPNAKFELIPTLKNSLGQTRNFKYPKGWWVSDNYAISSKSKNADVAVKLLDWMYSDEGKTVTNYGVENQDYTVENGKPVIKQETLDKYQKAPDVMRAMQSDLGTGFLSFCTYVDLSIQPITQPDLVPIIDAIKKDKNLRYSAYTPPLTKEEMDRIKEIRVELDTLFDKEMDKYILGVTPISAYDGLMQQFKEKGADELEKILAGAKTRYESSKK